MSRWAGIAAACALAVLLAASPASARVKQPPASFYGVVSQTRSLTPRDFERMAQGHVGTLRVSLPWSEVDPTPAPNDYAWERFDDVVAGASAAGVTVLPTVYTVPQWISLIESCTGPAGGPCSITPPESAYGLSAWRTFLAAAVRRYGAHGTFWAAHPSLPYQPVGAWQIWNEQNSPGFYQPKPDPEAYGDLLAAASDAIRGEDPTAEILLGGLFRYPLGGRDGGLRATEFLRELYARPGLEAAFDGVAIHPYAGRLLGVKRQVRRLAAVIDEVGDPQASIWITEVGWASGGKQTPLNRGLEGQARRLQQAFDYFSAERVKLGIRAVLWYAWRDVPAEDARCKWCARSGLFPTGSLDDPKPAWTSFVGFTGGS
jgi:hypothetical protein